METPVIYFYPKQELDIKVTAKLAQGRITEVYPPATTSLDGLTTWTGHLLPPNSPEKSKIPAADGPLGRHYAAARNVPDAWIYRNANQPPATIPAGNTASSPATENFIFYRGAGNASLTIRVTEKNDPDTFNIDNYWTSSPAIPRIFALKIANGKTSWLKLDQLESDFIENNKHIDRSQNISFPEPAGAASDVAVQLRTEMISTLTQQGLTPAEAAAMVATWDDLWFTEPGVRLLAILPQATIDHWLPLKISPAPSELKRVFVARIEVITKAKEQALLSILASPGDLLTNKQQFTELQLGRFAHGGLERAIVMKNKEMMTQFDAITRPAEAAQK